MGRLMPYAHPCNVDGCTQPRNNSDGYCKAHHARLVNHGDVYAHVPLGDRGGLYAALGKPIPHGVPRLIGRNADDCPKCAEVANLAAHGMDFHEIADRLSGCTDTYDRRRTLRKHLTGHGRTDLLAKITPQQESSAAQQQRGRPLTPIQPRTPGGKPEPGAWRQDRPAPPEPLPDWMEPRPLTREVACMSAPDLWFPGPRENPPAQVLQACDACWYRRDCRTIAIRTGAKDGIWGGIGTRTEARREVSS